MLGFLFKWLLRFRDEGIKAGLSSHGGHSSEQDSARYEEENVIGLNIGRSQPNY